MRAVLQFDLTSLAPKMRILSLSSVFPNPSEPGLGSVVEARLQALGKRAKVRVIAPIAPFDYDNPRGRGLGWRTVPFRRVTDSLEVFAPAWFYPPGSGFLNGLLLAIELAPFIAWMRIRRPFDIIDAHFTHPEGVAAALLAFLFRRPFTITLRGSEPRHARYCYRRRLMSWALRRASGVFAVSDELARLAVALGASPDSVRVAMNGVDPEFFAGIPLAATTSPKEWYEIVSVGRLVRTKGHQRVIRAVGALVQRGIPIRLRILGEAGRGVLSYEPDLRQLVHSLSIDANVLFEGWVPRRQLAVAMAGADILCLASDREGCPNVVREALACGTPVVAHDVGTVRRQIPDDRFGFIVPAGQDQALEDAIDQALKKKWDRPTIAAWGRARTWDTVAGELVRAFSDILSPAPAAAKESPAELKVP